MPPGRLLKKFKDRLLMRAARNRLCVFSTAYRAATVREWAREPFFGSLLDLEDAEDG